MKRKPILLGLATVCVVAGCSHGASVTNITVAKNDKFCTDTQAFQVQAAALESAATSGTIATIQQTAGTTLSSLQTLDSDSAKLPDKVNNHLVKTDIQTAVDTYTALTQALSTVKEGDQTGLTNALASVQTKEGAAFTSATDRLDAYTKKVCGLEAANPTTTVAPTTTGVPGPTVVPSVAPTTSVPGPLVGATTTTAPPLGPVAPTTTTP